MYVLLPPPLQIAAMQAPEEAARLGRLMQRTHPELLRPDFGPGTKSAIMLAALRAKFASHEGPREMLLSTAGMAALVEASPHDFFWGRGHDGTGRNQLGRLLAQVREEILQQGEQQGNT